MYDEVTMSSGKINDMQAEKGTLRTEGQECENLAIEQMNGSSAKNKHV